MTTVLFTIILARFTILTVVGTGLTLWLIITMVRSRREETTERESYHRFKLKEEEND